MIARSYPHLLVAATLAATPACDQAIPSLPAPADIVDRNGGGGGGAGKGGPILNTHRIFTSEIPAIDTTGLALDGVELVDVALKRGMFYVSIEPGTLRARHGELVATVENQEATGTEFIDSVWYFKVDGVKVHATLIEAETANRAGLWDPNSVVDLRRLDPDRYVYTFSYQDELENEITTCEEDLTGGARMVVYEDIVVDHETGAISGRQNSIYFGCLSGSVGKAALWGYAPDSPSLPSVSLPAFETINRVIRADYCGDGQPHTVEGNLLTLRDRWGINTFAPVPFTTEAVWEEGGAALCVSRERLTGLPPGPGGFDCGGYQLPLCGSDAVINNRLGLGIGDIWTKLP